MHVNFSEEAHIVTKLAPPRGTGLVQLVVTEHPMGAVCGGTHCTHGMSATYEVMKLGPPRGTGWVQLVVADARS